MRNRLMVSLREKLFSPSGEGKFHKQSKPAFAELIVLWNSRCYNQLVSRLPEAQRVDYWEVGGAAPLVSNLLSVPEVCVSKQMKLSPVVLYYIGVRSPACIQPNAPLWVPKLPIYNGKPIDLVRFKKEPFRGMINDISKTESNIDHMPW